MSQPPFHATWTTLQNIDADRPWLRYGEILAAVKAAGLEVADADVRAEIKRLPRPEKRHGIFHYTPDHLAAVIERLRTAAPKETA